MTRILEKTNVSDSENGPEQEPGRGPEVQQTQEVL